MYSFLEILTNPLRTLRNVFRSRQFPETQACSLAASSDALSFEGICCQVHNHSIRKEGKSLVKAETVVTMDSQPQQL